MAAGAGRLRTFRTSMHVATAIHSFYSQHACPKVDAAQVKRNSEAPLHSNTAQNSVLTSSQLEIQKS